MSWCQYKIENNFFLIFSLISYDRVFHIPNGYRTLTLTRYRLMMNHYMEPGTTFLIQCVLQNFLINRDIRVHHNITLHVY